MLVVGLLLIAVWLLVLAGLLIVRYTDVGVLVLVWWRNLVKPVWKSNRRRY